MSFRTLTWLASVFLAGFFAAIAGFYAWHDEEEMDAHLAEQAVAVSTSFALSVDSLEQQMRVLATLVAGDAEVRRLFQAGRDAVAREGGGAGGAEAARLRQALLERVSPRWKELQGQFGIRQLHFQFGPGAHSFLRVHAPEKFGDDLSDLRHIIVDVNRDQRPRTGFEVGRIYSGVRGVVPVWGVGEDGRPAAIGALEAGTSFDTRLAALDAHLGAGVAVLLKRELVEDAVWKEYLRRNGSRLENCDCYLEAASRPEVKDWMADHSLAGYGDQFESRRLGWHGRQYHLIRFPLRDYLGKLDPNRPAVGSVLIWRDQTDSFQTRALERRWTLAGIALAYLATQGILFWLLRLSRRQWQSRLEEEVAARSRDKRFHEALVDALPLALVVTDPDGQIVNVNPAFSRQTGYSREEALGQGAGLLASGETPAAVFEDFWRRLKAGRPWHGEFINRRKQGDTYPGWVEAAPLLDERGQVRFLLALIADETELKAAETALRESRERLELALAGGNLGLWDWNVATGAVAFDERWAAMLGYCLEDIAPHVSTWESLMHPEDKPVVEAILAEHLLGRTPHYESEHRLRHKDGHWVWVLDRGRLVERDAQGGARRMVGTHMDITARKAAEQAVRESEARFKLMFQGHSAVMLLIDPTDGRLLDANRAAEHFYGYGREQLLAMHIGDINAWPEAAQMAEREKALREERNYFIFPHRLASGELRTVEVHSSPIEYQGRKRLFSVIHDITERARAEAALRDSEAYNKLLFAGSLVALAVIDTDTGRFTDCNEAAMRLYGCGSREELLGRTPADMSVALQPDGMASDAAARYRLDRARQLGSDHFEWKHRRPDGEEWDGEVHLMAFTLHDRHLVQLSLRDITAERRAENALRESEERYRSLTEALTEGIVMQQTDGRIVAWNPSAERILGLSGAQMQGRESADPTWSAIREDGSPFPGEEHPAMVTLRTGLPGRGVVMGIRKPGGQVTWIRINAEPLRRSGEVAPYAVVTSFADITLQRQTEAALRLSERHLRRAQAVARVGSWYLEDGALSWSEETYRMLGVPQGSPMSYERFVQCVHPEDRSLVDAAWRRAMAGAPYDIEHRVLADGQVKWVHEQAELEFDNGEFRRAIGTVRDITAEREARAEVERLSRYNEQLLLAAGEGIFGIDAEGLTTFINPAALDLLGIEASDLLGRDQHALFHSRRPDGRPYPQEECPIHQTLVDGRPRRGVEDWFMRKDGSHFPVSISVASLDPGDAHRGAVVVFQDISARKAAEQALSTIRGRLAAVIANFHGGVLVEDQNRRVVLANQTLCELFGLGDAPEPLEGRTQPLSAAVLKPVMASPEHFLERLDATAAARRPAINEELALLDGRVLERDYVPITRDEQFLGHLWIYRDITERKERERELRRLATTDTLTGLFNRRHFLELFQHELARYHRHGKHAALLMLDLDHFKRVNDSYGHAVGDEVLRHFAHLAQQALRRIDLLGRLGGEEFAILLPYTHAEGAREFAERLCQRVRETPARTLAGPIPLTVSIGITLFRPEDADPDTILARADSALYRAKYAGRDRVEVE